MQKPAVVTGIAYIQLLTIWSMLQMYDTPLVGKAPLYLGSWLSPRVQWAYYAVSVLITILVTVGLFLGHNWARWLLLVAALAGWVAAFPVRDMHGVPLYLTSLLFGSIILWLLFLAPSARAYFSLHRTAKAPFSLRGFIATAFHANCALTLYSFSLYGFVHKVPLWMGLVLLLALPLPCLLLGMAARWNLAIACGDGATVLIAIASLTTFQFLAKALSLCTISPESLSLVDFKPALTTTIIAGMLGVALARASVRRGLRRKPNVEEAASSFG